MKNQGASSVFKRLFWLFMAVVVVIYLLITGLFVRFVLKERRAEEKTLQDRTVSTAELMEEQIRSVMRVQLQLFSDSRVAQLSLGLYKDAYERGELALELMEYIGNTQNINSIIENIIISFPLEGIELSADSGFDRKDFSDPASYHWGMNNPHQLIHHENHVELMLFYPLALAVDESYVPDFVVRSVLSQQHLQSSIAPLLTEEQGAFWLYHYKDQNELLHTETELDIRIRNQWLSLWQKADCPREFTASIPVNGITYFVTSCAVEDYNLVLISYQDSNAIPWKMGNSLANMTVVFLVMGLLFLMLTLWANKSVSKPIRIVMDAFESVRAGQRAERIYHDKKDEFGYIYASFNHMADRIDELVENVREQEALLQKAERIQLQSQINPHFLYNSFYNIKFMARNGDTDQIEAFVTALAKYYRFLNKETSQTITLAAEAEHMEHYTEIQQMRFGDVISVDIQKVPPEVASFKVPKLILQPIVENAYNYGFQNTLTGGKLQIRYLMDGKWLRIEIEDNGGNMNAQKIAMMTQQMNTFQGESLNHALTNIQRRLKLSFGDYCGMQLSLSEGNGLKVTILLDTQIRL